MSDLHGITGAEQWATEIAEWNINMLTFSFLLLSPESVESRMVERILLVLEKGGETYPAG